MYIHCTYTAGRAFYVSWESHYSDGIASQRHREKHIGGERKDLSKATLTATTLKLRDVA